MIKLSQLARAVSTTSLRSYEIARSATRHGANQKWAELTGLVHLIRQLKPNATMEIGLDRGGTLALWAQLMPPEALLVGVDLALSQDAETRIRSKMKIGQSLHLLRADSHTAETRDRIFEMVGARKLDFLFIDGDHSYEGVKQDFEDYSPLVRTGGIVAFHDIVPDFSTRFGIETICNAGGVHKFWREISSQFPHYEFIENIGQDGFGLGALRF